MATLGRSPGAAPLTSADIPDDSITGAKIVDDAIDSEHYTAGSVDAAHVAADVATQAELDAKEEFASGTKMVFNQTAAPTGWTKVTGSGDDHALRLTTGTVGTGGDVNFETAFADLTVTPAITMTNGAITLSAAQMAEHTHKLRSYLIPSPGSGYYTDIQMWHRDNLTITMEGWARQQTSGAWSNSRTYADGTDINGTAQGGSAHTHTNTAASAAVPIDLNVKFVDVIVATKD